MGPDDVYAATGAGDEDSHPVMRRSFPDYSNSLFQSGTYLGSALHVHFHHPWQSLDPVRLLAGRTLSGPCFVHNFHRWFATAFTGRLGQGPLVP